MIVVNCALMQDEIIKMVESISKYNFIYSKTEGIRLFFKTDAPDLNEAAKLVKSTIKATEIGKALYLNVVAI